MELQTEIAYDAALEDKSTDEYAAKKSELYAELELSLEHAADVTGSQLVVNGFDVVFTEVEGSR